MRVLAAMRSAVDEEFALRPALAMQVPFDTPEAHRLADLIRTLVNATVPVKASTIVAGCDPDAVAACSSAILAIVADDRTAGRADPGIGFGTVAPLAHEAAGAQRDGRGGSRGSPSPPSSDDGRSRSGSSAAADADVTSYDWLL